MTGSRLKGCASRWETSRRTMALHAALKKSPLRTLVSKPARIARIMKCMRQRVWVEALAYRPSAVQTSNLFYMCFCVGLRKYPSLDDPSNTPAAGWVFPAVAESSESREESTPSGTVENSDNQPQTIVVATLGETLSSEYNRHPLSSDINHEAFARLNQLGELSRTMTNEDIDKIVKLSTAHNQLVNASCSVRDSESRRSMADSAARQAQSSEEVCVCECKSDWQTTALFFLF